MRATFHGLFSLGVVLLGVLLAAGTLWSMLTAAPRDWLEAGRYVSLSAERHPPGSVTHYAFDEAQPPRPVGFYLAVGPDGRAVAVADRVAGCRLEWREGRRQWVDPCRGRAYPLSRVLAGEPFGGELTYLEVRREGGRLRVDLAPLLR